MVAGGAVAGAARRAPGGSQYPRPPGSTAGAVVGTVVVLVLALGWGVEAFVVTPLVLGAIFNYWWWARQGSRILRTTFWRFFFGKAPLAHG